MKIRSEDLVWQKVDSEIVVLDLRTSIYFRINGSGATLWERLVADATRLQLEAALVDAHGITVEQAESDVGVFLDDAKKRGFLEE